DKEVKESLDFDSESEDVEDEGPTAEDECPAIGTRVLLQRTRVLLRGTRVLGDETPGDSIEGGPDAQRICEPERPERVSALRHPTLTTWIDLEDGRAYIDVPTYPPTVQPIIKERRAQLDLAEIVASMRRGKEPRGDV
nr:hypothetical protein [Tanacetum cinerariifolium]